MISDKRNLEITENDTIVLCPIRQYSSQNWAVEVRMLSFFIMFPVHRRSFMSGWGHHRNKRETETVALKFEVTETQKAPMDETW